MLKINKMVIYGYHLKQKISMIIRWELKFNYTSIVIIKILFLNMFQILIYSIYLIK